MSRDLSVVLLAIFKAPNDLSEQLNPKSRPFKHSLEIVTAADTIFLPIEAEIMTSDEHRTAFRGNIEAGKNQLIRILSVRPTSTRDILTKKLFTQSTNKSNKSNRNNEFLVE